MEEEVSTTENAAPEQSAQQSAAEAPGTLFGAALSETTQAQEQAAAGTETPEKREQPQAGGEFQLPEEFRNDPAFANFKNLEDLCKSYRFAKQTIGKKTIGMITDQSTPEEVENFYRQLGKPESPDGYQAKFSDKMPEIFRQPEVFGKYLASFAKNNITEKQAAGLLADLEADVVAQLAEQDAARQRALQQSLASLKSDWGDNYNVNLNKAQEVWQKLRPDWDIRTHPLGDNMDVIRLMADIYPLIADDTMVKDGQSPAATVANIEAEMAQIRNNPAYWDQGPEHDRLMKRMEELSSRQRRLKQTPSSL